MRYRLLETLRQYAAQELLRAVGDAEVLAIRDKHAAHYLGLAKVAEPALRGSSQGDCLRRLDLEWDNLRAVFAQLAADDRCEEVLTLGVALARFAITRGHAEILACLRYAIDKTEQTPRSALAAALVATATITMNLLVRQPHESAAGRKYAQRALAMARAIGDQRQTALALALLAGATRRDDAGAARQPADEAVAIARQLGDVQLLGELLDAAAIGAPEEQQRSIYLEALSCARQAGDYLVASNQEHKLYGVDLHAGQIEDALPHAEEAVALAERGVGGDFLLYMMRTDLCLVLLITGEHARAEPLVRQGLLVVRRLGFDADASELLVGAACCATWRGDYQKAARLHGAAAADIKAALAAGAINWSEAEKNLQEEDQATLREILGDQPYHHAYRAGARLSPAQAVELALGRQTAA